MVNAGLSPQLVIAGATKNAAGFLQAKDLGTLERGKWADLIVREKNPGRHQEYAQHRRGLHRRESNIHFALNFSPLLRS